MYGAIGLFRYRKRIFTFLDIKCYNVIKARITKKSTYKLSKLISTGGDGMYGLRSIVIDEILAYAKEYGLKRVILFGSRARGDYKQRSDIDLAVEGGNVAAFTFDVDENTTTLLMFDVVNLADPIAPELRESINKEGIVLYEKV